MSDMLAEGLSWLTGQLKTHQSEPVIYRRGAFSYMLTACVGGTKPTLKDAVGSMEGDYQHTPSRVESAELDFRIPSVTLRSIFGPDFEPERGDVITRTGADLSSYVVLPSDSEPCWRWADPLGQSLFRIHAKRIL